MAAYNILSVILMPIYLLIPALILYFVIKLAVKELKNDGTIYKS